MKMLICCRRTHTAGVGRPVPWHPLCLLTPLVGKWIPEENEGFYCPYVAILKY